MPRSTPRATCLTVLAATSLLGLAVPLAAPAGAASQQSHGRDPVGHALRAPVTDESFYFVMADRFANGDTANDTGGLGDDPLVSGFDPTNKGFYNGGDLEGLLGKLDYIQSLGTDSIWLTPSFTNKAVQLEDGPSAGYHGYWITDFTRIDPHLGTNEDLGALVEAAHARGMKVYFDIITNHTADVIGYEEGARTAYVPKDVEPYRTADGRVFDDRDFAGTGLFPAMAPDEMSFPYTPVLEPGEEDLKVPAWLNDVTLYHNRGNTTFTGEDSQYGDFFGLDDLFTERPQVVNGFIDIYRTWVHDFGIDGFRIDTMKHVDDEFWQKFSPGLVSYARAHGKPDFFMFGEVALDGYDDAAKAFTSHYTVHDDVQAVLDFPFKDAARDFASRSADASKMADFFDADDWYTDADSNVYSLPTFLGNHDIGRIGYFLAADNPDAGEDELLARDRLAHELMYFSRGNPVVYYGDEQGFTGTGGDQLARQTMFPSLVPDYQDDDQIGSDATPAQDNFDPSSPLYRLISRLDALAEKYPALRDGAQQVQYAADGPGILASSRVDAREKREFLVVLNNSEQAQTAAVPTLGSTRFTKVYGPGRAALTAGSNGKVPATVQVALPPLSAAVYRADGVLPKPAHAPRIRLAEPAPSEVARGRMHVAADVAGSAFAEVTFGARVDGGAWQTIGVDDSAPYQVFHDTSDLAPGTPVQYRAVVLDTAGHRRASNLRATTVPAPEIRITSPTADGTVATIAPVLVEAAVDPEHATQTVRFERSVAGGAWQLVGVDDSSPVSTLRDDVGDLPVGTEVSYRAVLLQPGTPHVTSEPVTVTVAEPRPAVDTVTVAGSLQSEMGCPADWDPACADSRLQFDPTDGQWHGTFALPEGSYEWKVAIDGSWDVNYGAGGAAGGGNLALEVPAGGGTYRFTWDQVSHEPSVEAAS